MYRNVVVGLSGVVALFVAASSAQAGFVTINLSSLDGELIGAAVNVHADGSADVAVGEIFQPGQSEFNLDVDGMTDEDPVMTITKIIENTTGMPWIGYQIDLLDPAGATFVGTPINSDFTFDPGASTPTSLVFGAPGTLPSGNSLTVSFDINVPTVGDFGFTLAQQANVIPEPGTLLLGLLAAGAGSAVALRYRWG